MAALIRDYDWSQTSLGPIETWPQSLRTCIRIMLTSRQPIWIGWGKELIKFYNDPYQAIMGGKHPWALGKPASVVWKDIWKDIEPMLRQVMEKDEGIYVESQLLIMDRNGYPEETYYTFSYTPIPGDDGRTAGMFCANTEDTHRIISERQLRTLTQLGQHLGDCRSNQEIIEKTLSTLQENPADFPFAFFRELREGKAVLVHSTPLGEAEVLVPKEVDLASDHPIAHCINRALHEHKPQVFPELRKQLGDLPQGVWEVPPEKGLVIPIYKTGVKEAYGLLVIGLNPYRLLDDKYAGFFSLVGDQVATAFSDVRQLQIERNRAEALAEIDRAKTAFFSNISHEFRTPLTLLLGPIEEMLHDPHTTAENKVRMDVAYRNALRMQKLVNTLLEFSRIEAGRVEGKFSRVDICALTRELASTFRSAVEKAGLQLHFACTGVNDEIYVDVDMWEKIVLNLISNAFKYTKDGSITIRIREENNRLVFSVTDTGVGIPQAQLDKVFKRFHRIENMQGRSQEGTGIGLALVKELVKLHAGTIAVDSQEGKGSTFTVSIPTGKAHLPPEKIVYTNNDFSVSQASAAFVEEAMKWIPQESRRQAVSGSNEEISPTSPPAKKYKVLLADDNTDMRDYVERLLMPQFEVITAVDGEDAFQKLFQCSPDLLLTDVMMPRLDGFGLLQKIRQDPGYKTLPVVILSARAGEEAKVEGLEAGADDYLVKPFTARELLARVHANIRISKIRIAAENNLRNIILQSPVPMAILRGKNFVVELGNAKAFEIWGKRYEDIINRPLFEAFSELVDQGFDRILNNVLRGERFIASEMPVQLVRNGQLETVYLNFIYEPLCNSDNEVEGVIAVGYDVSAQVAARRKIEQSEKELNELANAVPQLVWVSDINGNVTYYNERVSELAGAYKKEDGRWSWEGLVHPADAAATQKAWSAALENGTVYQIEHRIRMKDGSFRWHLSRGVPFRDESGAIIKWFGSATDIHVSKEQANILEEEVSKRTAELYELNITLQKSNDELQQFAHVASHDLQEPLRKITIFNNLIKERFPISPEVEKYIDKSSDAARRMNGLIRSLLDYSRLGSGVRYEKVALNEILHHVLVDYELLIEQKNALVQTSELAVIEAIPLQMNQLFFNLIGNALKFTQSGCQPVITIHGEALPPEELENFPSLNPSKTYYMLRFRDNGIGFNPEYASKIFTIFQQLNERTQYGGYGIGLALCRKIAENHNGFIYAEGKPREGATFTVILPFRQQ